MKHPLSILLFFCILISCKESPETKFKKDRIQFICPSGWKITDEQDYDNKGFYVSVEKDGFDSSGVITISWINDSLDLNTWLSDFQEELRNNSIYKNSNLNFKTPTNDNFNNIHSIATGFQLNLLGVTHEGVIHVFYKNNKTIAILKQEAIEDKSMNKAGFDRLEQSFTIE
ncbi:hypothetical protein [Aquimarina sediminis]|uniref:hypothetical protein n=1 Tax=Aquimarina sediminis TaxID=2070536 RepID=UPI000CA03AB5|nr:hypothetical protein [Aquimarina sediminis]